MKDLQHRAESLFFPNGKSKVGPISDFDRSMMDFTEELTDPSVTLGELYEQKQVKLLRVYLATKKKSISESKNREDQSNGTSKDEVENEIFDSDENNLPDLNMSASGSSCDSANQQRLMMQNLTCQISMLMRYQVQALLTACTLQASIYLI